MSEKEVVDETTRPRAIFRNHIKDEIEAAETYEVCMNHIPQQQVVSSISTS